MYMSKTESFIKLSFFVVVYETIHFFWNKKFIQQQFIQFQISHLSHLSSMLKLKSLLGAVIVDVVRWAISGNKMLRPCD